MHPDPGVSATAASLIAELPGDATPAVAWCSLTTPCTAAFLPIAPGAELPAWLSTGTGEPDPRSAWWTMRALLDAVMDDPARRTPIVQDAWGAWEREMMAEVARDRAAAGPRLAERVAELRRRHGELLDRLRKEGRP